MYIRREIRGALLEAAMWVIIMVSFFLLLFIVMHYVSPQRFDHERHTVFIQNSKGFQIGSGGLIRPDIVLTAGHVTDGEKDLSVTFADGLVIPVKRVYRAGPPLDLALLELAMPLAGGKFATMPECQKPPLGYRLVGHVSRIGMVYFAQLEYSVAFTGPEWWFGSTQIEEKPIAYEPGAIMLQGWAWPGFSGGLLTDDMGRIRAVLTGFPTITDWQSGPFPILFNSGLTVATAGRELCDFVARELTRLDERAK